MLKKALFSIICLIMLISALAVTSITLNAESPSRSCGDNVTWTLNVETGVLTISGNGAMYNYSSTSTTTYAPWSSYVSYIESIVVEEGVTHIGAYAFVGCTELESVSIPKSVTSMGFMGFDNTPALKSIYITDMVAWCNIDRVDGAALAGSARDVQYDLYLNEELVTDLVIPSSVKIIVNHSFWQIGSIKTVVIHNSVTSIEKSAFCYCTSLTDVVIGSSVKTIEGTAFGNCDSLLTVLVPESVTTIDYFVFTIKQASNYYAPNKNVTIKCFENSTAHYYAKKNELKYVLIKHSFTSYTYFDATCTEDAYGIAYCDNGCDTVDIRTETGSALGHSFTNYTSDNNASCIKNCTERAKCNNGCGTVDIRSIEGTAFGHSFTDYISDNNATCLSDGTKTAVCDNGCGESDTLIIEGSALGHSFTNYIDDNNTDCLHDGTETAVCDNGCGASDTVIVTGSALGHSFTDYVYDNNATCTEDGTETALCDNGCTSCDVRTAEGSALGHSYTEYEVTQNINCTENGISEAYCDNGCGEKDIIIEEAKGHISSGPTVVEEPTYYLEGVRIQYCTVCKETLNHEIIPMLIYKGFADVWKNSWYAEGIEYCFKHGYILGCDDGTFKPNAELTREQFVTVLARVEGADLSKYTKSPFTDVNAKAWYGPSVIWASTEGLVMGLGDGSFGVGKVLNREQLAAILYRYAERRGMDTTLISDLSYCNDADEISDWALQPCAWAIKAKLLGSTSEAENLLSPRMTVTRAQMAKIFMSLDNIE